MFTALVPWIGFLAFVCVMLALDLGVFNRHAREITRREALVWSTVWIGLALLFNAGVFLVRGRETGIQWMTGYLIEKSLSVDNIFVFLLIFSTFAVPPAYQRRVLFWGILGALVMRAILILLGAALLSTFHFIIYIFGGFLILTGIKFLRGHESEPSLDGNRVVKLARRLFPTTNAYEGQRFFVRKSGALYMTPLFLVLLLIESTDLVFAVDSIPAIFAITDDPFVVFTSNIFAILGLRALFFVLQGYLAGLIYLKPALAAVLIFVGTKMTLVDVYKIPALVSLGVIVGILSVSVWASIIVRRRREGTVHAPAVPRTEQHPA